MVDKSKRLQWAGHVARIGKHRVNCYGERFWKEDKERREDNIKANLTEVVLVEISVNITTNAISPHLYLMEFDSIALRSAIPLKLLFI